MADPRNARPVSGEIMADGSAMRRQQRQLMADTHVTDADYEIVATPRTQPTSPRLQATPPPVAGPEMPGMDMLRQGSGARPARFSRGGPVFWIVGVGLALAAFWVAGGHTMLTKPGGESDFATQPVMVISNVTSRVDVSGPKPVLFVDGQAGNSGGAPGVMSELEIHVTGNDGRLTRYKLGTAGRQIAAGETFAFSSRLDVPRNGVKTVSVTFGE